MLVLSRKREEQVVVGPPDKPLLVVTVVYIEAGKVKLGFEADPSIAIFRRELLPPVGPAESKGQPTIPGSGKGQ
jgi:carbon storage regulator CsrA